MKMGKIMLEDYIILCIENKKVQEVLLWKIQALF